MLRELRNRLNSFPSCKLLEFYIMIYGNASGTCNAEDYANHILCGYRFNIKCKRNIKLSDEKRTTHLFQAYVMASWFEEMSYKYNVR